jgi:hypothetical protein
MPRAKKGGGSAIRGKMPRAKKGGGSAIRGKMPRAKKGGGSAIRGKRPRAKKGGGSVFPTNMYGGAEIQQAAAEYGRAILSHVPDAIRERIKYIRDEGYEVLADELYDQYTEEAG